MTQLFHAFYSKTQSTIRNNLQKTKDLETYRLQIYINYIIQIKMLS